MNLCTLQSTWNVALYKIFQHIKYITAQLQRAYLVVKTVKISVTLVSDDGIIAVLRDDVKTDRTVKVQRAGVIGCRYDDLDRQSISTRRVA